MSRYKKLNIVSLLLLAGLVALHIQLDISFAWYLILLSLYLGVCAVGTFVMAARLFLTAVVKGDNSGRRIAITFDDGPIQGKTGRILDILQMHKVEAAFFCIGMRIEKNKELLARIDREHHLVGNHTYHHKNTFGFLSRSSIVRELNDTDTAIAEILGKKPRFFRPPFGVTNPMIAGAVRAGEYKTIGWSIRSFDTIIKDSGRLLRRGTASLTPGDIVLFHDYSDSMVEILPEFIQFARHSGFEIVRLDKLLNENAYR